MNEVKFDGLLTILRDEALKVANKDDVPFTAECFLVALFNRFLFVEAADFMKWEEEFDGLYEAVKAAVENIAEARYTLMEYIRKDNFLFDTLYMKKRIQSADLYTRKVLNKEYLSSMVLLQHIIYEPSEVIKSILKKEELEKSSKDDEFNGELKTEAMWSKKREAIAALVDETNVIRAILSEAVHGQEHAIEQFAVGYFQANMSSLTGSQNKRPKATFLFAGPPGVGKTFLSEKAAEALKLPFKRFDMSEYSDKEANLEFCGSDKVYKNGNEGNVTGFVSQNPKCVLLFDEIEKANLCVIYLFLQMLDAGRLRDNYTDKEVSFSDTIIIFTTNAGKQLYDGSNKTDFSDVSRKVIINALQKDINPSTQAPYFPAAMCSRFASGNVVMFNHIGANNLRIIAKKEIERLANNFENQSGINVTIDDKVFTALLFAEGANADARTVRGRTETFFNDELYELLRLITSKKAGKKIEDIKSIHIGIDLRDAGSEINELYENDDEGKILVFSSADVVNCCADRLQGYNIFGAQEPNSAIEIIKNNEIDFILIDMKFGTFDINNKSLNIEDVESKARDFYKFMLDSELNTPIYLVEKSDALLDEQEIISFMEEGVRGTVSLSETNDDFKRKIDEICSVLHQQEKLMKLSRENKLVSYETAQSISESGKEAEIKLFDFKMEVAVDSEDSKNIISSVSRPDVKFDEVIGAEEAKKELKYFVEYLKNPKKYIGTGLKNPKGVILYGPPGTGKTMLAKAMASESNVTFIAAEGNQFLKRFAGEGAESVHELFRVARKYAPSVLFIDEIDAIAKERRGAGNGSDSEETLTAFLTEMDGFSSDTSRPVFVLAATNFDVEPGGQKSLDPALMRRFDRRVYIELPGKKDRIKFMKMKIESNKALDISEKQVENIAVRSTGMSLAEMESAIEMALRSAIREGSSKVTDAIFEEAFETFNNGETKKWNEDQLERVARHEAGHALICWHGGEIPSYMTIVARGDHGGYMQHDDNEGKAIYTKDELLSKIRTSLGGRAAEIVYYGDKDGISTGAGGDLVSATNIANQIVCAYGMDDDFGLSVVSRSNAENSAIAAEVRGAVNNVLKEQMKEAINIISENKDKLDLLVSELLAKNYLSQSDIESILTK